MTPTGTLPPVEPTVSFTQAEVQSWIRFRLVYGLQADAALVILVATDPRSSTDPYGVPLLPAEIEQVAAADTSAQGLVPIARGFADDFPEFGGAWLELPRVVLAFTGNLAERQADVSALFGTKVTVRQVRFSLQELQHFQAAVLQDRAWFSTVGAEFVDISVDEASNTVNVHLRYTDLAVQEAARQRYGDTGWMRFAFDRPPPWTGPLGALKVMVVDHTGRGVAVDCIVGSTDPRVEDERTAYSERGECFFADLPSVTWSLRVDYDLDGDRQTIFKDYLVPAGGIERDSVTISP